jgi:hypothetical protein
MNNLFVFFLLFSLIICSCKNGNTNSKNKALSRLGGIPKTINYPTDTNHKFLLSDSNKINNATSDFFTINNLTCYWRFITNYQLVDGKKSDFANFSLQLIERNSNQIILHDSDFISINNIDSVDVRLQNFKDINFDGYKDFINPNQESSGAGGEFFNVYLFNPAKHVFEFSNELSNSDLEIDSTNRTLTSFWKTGVSLNIATVTHFDKKGKIEFKENIKKEEMSMNDKSKLVTTTKKTIDKKIISITVDTSDLGF